MGFFAVTGGRAQFFSRLGYGGNRSPEPFDLAHGPEPFDRLRPRATSRGKIEGLVEGNAEGARLPRKQVAEKTSP
jgi:hypothetical protein